LKRYKIVFYVQDMTDGVTDHFKSEWKQTVIEIEPGNRDHRAETVLAAANVIARHIGDLIDAGAVAQSAA
jgi:hypothetical protein